jgi:hypothetical protein
LPLQNEIPAAFDQRQEQQFLLDAWSQMQQITDLRVTRPTNVPEARQLGLIHDSTVAEEAVEADRQRHALRDLRHPARLRNLGWFFAVHQLLVPAAAGTEMNLGLKNESLGHAASPSMVRSVNALIALRRKVDRSIAPVVIDALDQELQ